MVPPDQPSERLAARRDWTLWLLVGVAAALCFAAIGRRALWQDEAETACLARNTLRFGVPLAYDGKNLISQEVRAEFGPDYVWRWSPWVQFDIAAASMWLFGPSTVAVRLPFVLLGLATIPLTYLLARRLFGSVRVARLSVLFLTLSVWFLLHIEQARWHAPAYLIFAVLLLSVAGLSAGRWPAWIGVAAATALLFYTNYFVAVGAVAAVALAAPLLCSRLRFLMSLATALLMAGVAIWPGVVFFDLIGKQGAHDSTQVFNQFCWVSMSYLSFLVPLPILILLGYLLARRSGSASLSVGWRQAILFLMALTAVYVVYLSFAPWWMFRYTSVLFSVAAILCAVAVDRVYQWDRSVGLGLLLVLLVSNAVHQVPFGIRAGMARDRILIFPSLGLVSFPLMGYAYELVRPPEAPQEVLCNYLNEHAATDDVVLISYGDLSLQFYTGLRVTGGMQGQPYPSQPDWIIIRGFTMSDNPGKDGDVRRWARSILERGGYERVFTAPDSGTPNNPDPYYHLFHTPSHLRNFVVWRKRK
jgi:4-amino-4-deoxy-L-arabinose transferase-like glycosyltransferase